jgi:hypothetical protein
MVSGCGDNQLTTSYGCFCVSSSAKFDRVIGTAVESRCTDSPQEAAASALSVFDSYCHLLSVPAGMFIRVAPWQWEAVANHDILPQYRQHGDCNSACNSACNSDCNWNYTGPNNRG